MNHRTPAEERLAAAMSHRATTDEFRARLGRLSLPQLVEAMLYLRDRDEAAMERALAFAATPFTAPDENLRGFMRAAMEHLALDGTAPSDPLTVDCPDCGAAAGDRCWTDFGCMARFSAAQVTS